LNETQSPGDRLLRGLLTLAELPYAAAVNLRNTAFDTGQLRSQKVAVPVISVGNLTVGGTGKTPLIIFLCRAIERLGGTPAIVSRGYGVRKGKGSQEIPNDEAREMSTELPHVPHIQDRDRVEAAWRIVQNCPDIDCVLVDDGFQHRRLFRDLDIVLIDATSPFGGGHMLPRGLLRESLRGLRRADVVVLTRVNQIPPERLAELRPRIQSLAPQADYCEIASHPTMLWNVGGESKPVEELHGARIAAFAGIGNPEAFCCMLQDLPWELVAFREFPDHHPYPAPDQQELAAWLHKQGPLDAVLCTRKDLVKIPHDDLAGIPLWGIKTDLEWRTGWPRLESRLKALIAPGRETSQI
jgi:tetraacyldisaccharide 4'-kinase